MFRNIIFIGFMGSGKSSIGRKIARLLAMDFVDTDSAIEKLTGLTIPRIFKKHGEIRFRSEETLMLKKLCKSSGQVISTGGGAVLKEENRKIMCENNIVICLTAQPEVISKRIKRNNNRPLLRKNKSPEYIAALMKSREEYYRIAHLTIDTSLLGEEEVMRVILDFLKKEKTADHGENKS